MHTVPTTNERSSERGNVLFLILIAVALFAALSYAVTQSTRSGAGSSDNETGLINSAQLTQYPAGVRTAVVRMIIGGTAVENLSFNVPSDFDELAGIEADGVFYPTGGGATYANAPGDVMANGNQGEWVFNSSNQINLIGQTDASNPTAGSADIIAFLPGLADGVCRKINDELGVSSSAIPAETGVDITEKMVAAGGVAAGLLSTTGGTIGDTADDNNVLNGQPFGCFSQGGQNIYYHVLVER